MSVVVSVLQCCCYFCPAMFHHIGVTIMSQDSRNASIPQTSVSRVGLTEDWTNNRDKVKVSKVGDRSWELPEGSLFNSYYTEV